MKAAVAHELPSDWLSVEQVPEPRLKRSEDLLLEVEACGICGTDLHILDGTSYRPALPAVLGHEPVGRVVQSRSRESDYWLGRRVAVNIFRGCNRCEQCAEGNERLCSRLRSITGVHEAWGGFAEKLVVSSRQVLDVPEVLPTLVAAAIVDSGATAANAVQAARSASPRLAVVAGAGPLGFLVAELLRASGIPLSVVQPSLPRRLALQTLGHHVVADHGELSHLEPDVIIDCAGDPRVIAWALPMLKARGQFIAAGYATVPRFDMATVARKELTLKGIRSGSRRDLQSVMEAAAGGVIRTPTIRAWHLDDINQALAALRDKMEGKAVIALRSHA